MGTRERRHQQTREAILDAAQVMILERGFDRLSLRGVARAADYSPAGLYEYFANKEAILEALSVRGMSKFYQHLEQASQPHEGHRLVEMGLAYIHFARENPEDFMLLFSRMRSHRTTIKQEIPAQSPYSLLLDAVNASIQDGSVKLPAHMNPDQIAYAIWSLSHGAAMLQLTHLSQFEEDFQAVDRFALEALIEGLKT